MAVDVSGETGMDFSAHMRTYHAFVKLLKYSVAGLAVLLVLMARFLL